MKTWDRQPRSPKNFVYKSGRGRALAALVTLEPASRGLFVVCVRCDVFQIQTFPSPDFRQGPAPKITHIFGAGPCRKPVAGNFKPKMCYFRQRKKPKNSQNRKRAKKSLEFRQLKKRPKIKIFLQDFVNIKTGVRAGSYARTTYNLVWRQTKRRQRGDAAAAYYGCLYLPVSTIDVHKQLSFLC